MGYTFKLYLASTVVLLAECLKITLTLLFLLKESNYALGEFRSVLRKEFFDKPVELLKMSIPSLAYVLQNNLEFVALSNLEAHAYQVISQLKVVTTAIFMMVFLRRTFSIRRWIAILMLFGGVALVQVSQLDEKAAALPLQPRRDNAFIGLIAILACCATAGFAGVYFEMLLKDGSSTPFWIRNLQMYICGIIGSSIGCFMADSTSIKELGFFHGYNKLVLSLVCLMGLNGLYISLVMKVLDNLHKSFASSVSIVVVILISLVLFPDAHVGPLFFVGASVVVCSIALYNSVSE